MDCFDKDERPCRSCGLWLEGVCPNNKEEIKDINTIFINRIEEIHNTTWSNKI